jgi:nicotinic acid phosphoribosyltransferase
VQLQAEGLGALKIADYGTRRRFGKAWHEEVLRTLVTRLGTGAQGQLAGTSNVLFAMKLGLTPLGTMAHEYLQACQALGPRLRDSQVFGFESWAKEYRGDLGIALSDVYGMSAFLRDFDMYFCKLFDGARHDSGDPFQWGERMLAHYTKNRVDPKTKTLIFSDGLTVPRTIELYQQFKGRCQLAFGIGTNLTNDLGYEPLQIVIKMIRCNGQPVAKLSDTPSKNMCDDEKYLAYLRQVFEIGPHEKDAMSGAALPLRRWCVSGACDGRRVRRQPRCRAVGRSFCGHPAVDRADAAARAFVLAPPLRQGRRRLGAGLPAAFAAVFGTAPLAGTQPGACAAGRIHPLHHPAGGAVHRGGRHPHSRQPARQPGLNTPSWPSARCWRVSWAPPAPPC